jgi:hypothetical protein
LRVRGWVSGVNTYVRHRNEETGWWNGLEGG